MNSRRAFLAQLGALAAVVAACGSDDTTSAETTAPSTTAAPGTSTATTAATAAFPVTVEHFLGSTTIDAQPSRVVTLGDFTDLDTLVALGVTPVAFGFTDSWETGLTPWQRNAGIDEMTQFAAPGAEINLETVAGFSPDLILGMPAPAEDLQAQLTAIAPLVTLGWDSTWQDSLRIVGQATGRSARATELRGDVEAAISDAATKLGAYADQTIIIGSFYGDVLYVQGAQSPMTVLLTALGLTVKPGPDPVLTELSFEQVDQLAAADVLLSLATDVAATTTAEASPLWQQLPAVQAGKYTAVDATLSRAMADGFGALSYAWALPRVVDLITETASGRGTPLTAG